VVGGYIVKTHAARVGLGPAGWFHPGGPVDAVAAVTLDSPRLDNSFPGAAGIGLRSHRHGEVTVNFTLLLVPLELVTDTS
jgi:hypothetical protein